MKVQKGNGFWTFLEMSIFEKPEKVLKKGVFFDICHENAHNYEKISNKFVMINFYKTRKKTFRDFFIRLIYILNG